VDDVVAVLIQAGGNVFALLAKGGFVMVPLMVCSIVSLTVIIERFFFWRYLKNQAGGETILSLVAAGDVGQAMRTARISQHPVAQVLLSGLEHQHPVPGMAMEAAAQTALHRLKRYLPALDTVITLAPLLGLLGTVTGMIGSFGIVSEAGLGQPQAITGGVAEALIATATGLAIAILTLMPYNYFRAKADVMTDLIEAQATHLEMLLKELQESEK
jgi:biopolymer transport protein ExbB